MGSEFVFPADKTIPPEGWKERLQVESERFLFFKVRVHGVLQLLKTPKPKYTHDLLALESLRKEFLICYGLTHIGLPRYYALDGDRLYQEYIEGETLRHLIERKDPRLADWKFLERICRQLLEVLDYLHSHGVVHLDIKPENIMLTTIGEPQLKLIDFGGAMSTADATTPGFTPNYMAPEQNGGQANFYTDIYQTGLLMEELSGVGGHRKKWRAFISRATGSEPSARFASCGEALASMPSVRVPGIGSRLMFWSYLLLAVVILLATAIWFSKEERNTAEQKEVTLIEGIENVNPDMTVMVTSDEIHDTEAEPAEKEMHSPMPSQQVTMIVNSNQKLKNEITGYVRRSCEEILSPVIREMEFNENGGPSFETEMRYRDASYDVYYRCEDYAEKLVARNPSNGDMIKMMMRNILEEELLKWHERYAARFKQQER